MIEPLTNTVSTKFESEPFTNSRRMTIDRANTELSAVLDLPWPFGDLHAEDWQTFLETDRSQRDELVCKALGLPPIYQELIDEFTEFREAFTDGRTPIDAMYPSEQPQIDAYVDAILHEIDGGKGRYSASVVPVGTDLLATVVRYQAKGPQPAESGSEQLIRAATKAYAGQGASAITQSRYLWHSRALMATVLLKPRERMHWTLDRAFADADLVTAAAMAGYNSQDAA